MEFDAVVVGSGAGGGTAASVLTRRGWRVAVLEKGPMRRAEDFLPLDELEFHTRKALIPSREDDPNIYMGETPTPVERWWTPNMVGGATMIWDANVPRYTVEDFRVLDYLRDVPAGADMVNWPWTYEEFEPWFELAEKEWGVSGLANQSPAQEPTRPGYEYPMPPLPEHPSTPFVTDTLRRAGMHPYLGPKAINSRVYDGRPACSFCGLNQFFGCAVNSRASAVNTVLRTALATGRCELRPGCCVTRLDFADGRVRGVHYLDDGAEKYLAAPVVIVSIQPIESARLFLHSQIPDPNRMIGHYLTYHSRATAELTFPLQPVWDAAGTGIGSLQLRDLYTVADGPVSKAGKFSIYDPYTCTPPIRLLKSSRRSGPELREYLRELRTQGGVSFSFTGEALSMYDNRVELDPQVRDPWGLPAARVHYRHPGYDVALAKYAIDRVVQIMTDAGGELRGYETQKPENPGYGHVHGTLRAGVDPGSSVLDADCQSHTVRGLYVLDNSFMPTAGASNPTMTLLANAYRVCTQM